MLQKILITIYFFALVSLLTLVNVKDSYHNTVFNYGQGFSNLNKAQSFAFRKYNKKQLINLQYIWSDFNNSVWEDCEWNGLSLFETSVKNVKFKNCTIQNSLFLGVDFRGAEFKNVNFKGNLFVSCRFDLDLNLDQLNKNYSRAN